MRKRIILAMLTVFFIPVLILWVLAMASLAGVAYLVRCYFQEGRRRANGGRKAALIGQKRSDPAHSTEQEASLAETARAPGIAGSR